MTYNPSLPTFFEVYTTFVAAFSFFCTGLLRAYTSPAISSMKEDHILLNSTSLPEKDIISWVASTPPLGAFLGTLMAGPMLQYLGRRGTLIALSIPYIIGWLFIAFPTPSVALIFSGRALTGVSGGLSTATAQVYVSECVRAERRGMLGYLPAMMLAFGVLIGFTLSTLNLTWRNLALLMTVFPSVLLFMSFTIPESPFWLFLRGKETEGVKNIKILRGKQQQVETLELEILDMKRTTVPLEIKQTGSSGFLSVMKERSIWYPGFIAVVLMFFQQFCGANVVIFYLSIILSEAEPPTIKNGMDHNVSSVIVGVVQFLAFFLSLPLIDRLGRRILLISSAIAMAVPLGTLSFYYYCNNQQDLLPGGSQFGTNFVEYTGHWLPLTCLSVFIAAYSIGFGPVCFILMGELFPTRARSYLVSLTSFVSHLGIFIVIRSFPIALDLIGAHGTFATFFGSCLLSVLFVLWIVPETKGKTLAEIQTSFMMKHSDGNQNIHTEQS